MSEDDDFQNPQHWRDRAGETRTKANDMHSPDLKERMLIIADEYDRLADMVASRNAKERQRAPEANSDPT
jgi:hypothetical protein